MKYNDCKLNSKPSKCNNPNNVNSCKQIENK